MKPRAHAVDLQYRFVAGGAGAVADAADAAGRARQGTASAQQGAAIGNALFDLLAALREHGSIQQAALAAGMSYRHFWGSLKQWQERLGEPLVTWTQGQPARLTPFAARLLAAEAQARARLAPHIEALRAELARVLDEAFEGPRPRLALWAAHEPALARLRELAAAQHGLHLELRDAGSVDALQALADGRCTLAAFHVPLGAAPGSPPAQRLKPLLDPDRHVLVACGRRRQGLLVARGNPLALRGLADAAAAVAAGARFVPRRRGSGTALLLEQLCQAAGVDAARLAGDVPAEDSQLAVAAAVAGGGADVGLGIEAAAHEFGLGFVPLAEEEGFVCGTREAFEQPPAATLRELLGSAAWRAALAGLPGYAPARSGELLAPADALAWWRPRARRRSGIASHMSP